MLEIIRCTSFDAVLFSFQGGNTVNISSLFHGYPKPTDECNNCFMEHPTKHALIPDTTVLVHFVHHLLFPFLQFPPWLFHIRHSSFSVFLLKWTNQHELCPATIICHGFYYSHQLSVCNLLYHFLLRLLHDDFFARVSHHSRMEAKKLEKRKQRKTESQCLLTCWCENIWKFTSAAAASDLRPRLLFERTSLLRSLPIRLCRFCHKHNKVNDPITISVFPF